jgi:hypothetical protein
MTCRSPCSPCSRVGGWLAGRRRLAPFGDWLDRSRRREHSLVEPTRTQDYVTSALAVGSASLGIYVAWVLYGAASGRCRAAPCSDALEHKFWFDELYDLSSTRPPSLLALLRAASRSRDRRLDLRRRAGARSAGAVGGPRPATAQLRARDRRSRSPSSSSSS